MGFLGNGSIQSFLSVRFIDSVRQYAAVIVTFGVAQSDWCKENMSVDSKPFKEHGPTIDPPVLEVKFPTKGKDTDIVKFTIKNNCADRITYKMKGTKTDKFKVVEGFGFVEPKGSTVVELYPIEMKTNSGWSKFDYFAVILAPAPKGEHWDPREIWKKGNEMEPKQLKTIKLNLLSLAGKPEADVASSEASSAASSEESDAE